MKATIPQPATPLPWAKSDRPPVLSGPNGEQVAEFTTADTPDHVGQTNAAYAHTACMAYPQLVDALKAIIHARDSAALADDPAYLLIDRAIEHARELLPPIS